MPELTRRRKIWGTEISEEAYDSVHNMFPENLMAQSDLGGYIETLYSYCYQLRNASSFQLCLAAPWRFMSEGRKP